LLPVSLMSVLSDHTICTTQCTLSWICLDIRSLTVISICPALTKSTSPYSHMRPQWYTCSTQLRQLAKYFHQCNTLHTQKSHRTAYFNTWPLFPSGQPPWNWWYCDMPSHGCNIGHTVYILHEIHGQLMLINVRHAITSDFFNFLAHSLPQHYCI
jgi:hypothetical protein